jgi:hypothetical protein
MPALVVLGRANKRCEKRSPQYIKNKYLATFVFVVYIPICKMIESIKKPTKGKKNGRSKQI